MNYSLLPKKHYSLENTIIWNAPKVLSYIDYIGIDIENLYDNVSKNNNILTDYEYFLLVLDYLFIIGQIIDCDRGVKRI